MIEVITEDEYSGLESEDQEGAGKVVIERSVHQDDYLQHGALRQRRTINVALVGNAPKVLVQLQSFNRKVAGNLRTKTTSPDPTGTSVRLQLDYSDKDNNTLSIRVPGYGCFRC